MCISAYELKIISVIFNLPVVAYKIGRDLHNYASVDKKKTTTTDGPSLK